MELPAIKQAKAFTKVNLNSVYNLIHIKEWGEWKIAFIIISRLYEYLVIPYGLVSAPLDGDGNIMAST